MLSEEYLNAIRYYWLAILAGAVVVLTGFAMSLNTSCFGISPYALYWLCEDYAALVVTIAGSLIMIIAAILLSGALFKSRRSLSARPKEAKVTTTTDILETSKKKKTTRIWTLVIIAIAIACILLTSSAIRAAAWQVYITKIPLHVGIEGLNNTYEVGEKIDFYVTLEGYGYYCGFPNISVWKSNVEKTGSEKTIWQLGSSEGNGVCSIFPVDVSKQVVHVGGSEKPLIVNETGIYVASIEGSIGQEFEIANKRQE